MCFLLNALAPKYFERLEAQQIVFCLPALTELYLSVSL